MLRTWLGYLEPDNLLSRPVFIISFPWVTVVNLLTVPAPVSQSLRLLAVVVAVQLIMFGLIWIMTSGLRLSGIRGLAMSMGLLIVIAVGAAIRGLLVGNINWGLGLTEQPLVAGRALSSSTILAIVLIITTIATGRLRSTLHRGALLKQQQARLVQLREQAEERICQINEDLVAAIQAQLLERLRPLATGTAGLALATLRRTIDEVVRPISYRLAEPGPAWVAPEDAVERPRLNTRQALLQAADPSCVRPWPILTVIVLVMAPSLVTTAGLLRAVVVLPMITGITWLALSFIRDVGGRLTAGRPVLVRALVFVGSLFLFGLALTWIAQVLLTALGDSDSYVFRGESIFVVFRYTTAVFIVVVAYVIAVYQSAQRQALDIASQLAGVDADLRWELARARELERQRRRMLANALHGGVQAALTAAYLRIQNDAAPGVLSVDTVNEIRADLQESIDRLAEATSPPRHVDEVMDLVRANWAGVTDIAFTCPPDVKLALLHDQSCLSGVNDTIPELCFNAIKHANASHIEVALSWDTSRSLLITVRNDGSPPREDYRAGLGDMTLEQCGLWWCRSRQESWTVTQMSLPCVVAYTTPAPTPMVNT